MGHNTPLPTPIERRPLFAHVVVRLAFPVTALGFRLVFSGQPELIDYLREPPGLRETRRSEVGRIVAGVRHLLGALWATALARFTGLRRGLARLARLRRGLTGLLRCGLT
jgi:hypothetical protein